jgi:hypothetical protein
MQYHFAYLALADLIAFAILGMSMKLIRNGFSPMQTGRDAIQPSSLN